MDVVEQIQKATSNSLMFAFDTISEATTQLICVKSLAPAPEGSTPGKLIVVLGPKKEAQDLRKDVVIQREHSLVVEIKKTDSGNLWAQTRSYTLLLAALSVTVLPLSIQRRPLTESTWLRGCPRLRHWSTPESLSPTLSNCGLVDWRRYPKGFSICAMGKSARRKSSTMSSCGRDLFSRL